jgi:ATP-dependent Clp protease ATP-binding subunit ClpX
MKMDGIDLIFEEDALREIAKNTVERKMGARGLRSSVEGVLRHIMFDAPSNKKIKTVTVTKECITENKEPKIA